MAKTIQYCKSNYPLIKKKIDKKDFKSNVLDKKTEVLSFLPSISMLCNPKDNGSFNVTKGKKYHLELCEKHCL